MPFVAAGAAIGGLAGGAAFTGTVGTAITWGGTILGAGLGLMAQGAYTQYEGAKQQAKAEKAMYQYNEQARLREAAQIRRASLEEQRLASVQKRRYLASRRVAYAKAGVTFEGTPFETQLDAALTLSEDISRMALKYEIGAERETAEAGLQRFYAKTAVKAGRLNQASAIYGGLGNMATMGMNYQLNRA